MATYDRPISTYESPDKSAGRSDYQERTSLRKTISETPISPDKLPPNHPLA